MKEAAVWYRLQMAAITRIGVEGDAGEGGERIAEMLQGIRSNSERIYVSEEG